MTKKVAKKAAKKAAKKTTKKLFPVKKPLDLAAYHRDPSEKRIAEVAVGHLYLDPLNPRLADSDHTGTQASILKVLEKDFDLQPLIDSMYKSGFFWEEPLVAVKEKSDELRGREVLHIIEGNRRLAALKILHGNPEKYSDLEARNRLEKVPVIVRGSRQETLAFVGFRHITGIVPWEAAAKAQYAHGLVKSGHSLTYISQLIGDRTKDIARWVRTKSLVDIANENGLRESDAEKAFYFSYLLTSTDAPATKKWLGMQVDDDGIVTSVDIPKLDRLWKWLYGSKASEISPVVPESRQIHKLNKIIANPAAVRELIRTNLLERALIETQDRGDYVIETLVELRSLLQDLAANLAGEGPIADIVEDPAQLKQAKNEFGRVEKALAETKSKLGF